MSGNLTSTMWDVRVGDALTFEGADIRIEVVSKSGQLARFRVVAPADVEISKDTAKSVPSMTN